MVTQLDDAGPGSLRQAILDANAKPGLDTIAFAIGEGGSQTIAPFSALPTITDSVVVDGTTQPGYAGRPLLELTGVQAGSQANGLHVTAGASTIRGLVINGFAQYGILLENVGSNVIAGNYLGTDLTGTLARGNRAGLRIAANSNENIIGGITAADRNLVSGNVSASISITSASGNVVQGNYLGTDVTGTSGVGLTGNVLNASGSDNLIGGTGPGAGNLISKGVTLAGRAQRLQGNYIGTDVTGTQALGLGDGVFTNGVDHVIGGTEPGAGNLISGNPLYGLLITGPGAARVVVQGNFVGTDITGTGALPNGGPLRRSAVLVNYCTECVIGGSTPEARNIISGNTGVGVELASSASNNRIQGNYIGTDVTGTRAIPNAESGVLLGSPFGGANENLIGGTEPGAGNLISGNGAGVTIHGRDNIVRGNVIGTDVTGSYAIPNQLNGVLLHTGSAGFVRNLVGGTEKGAGNLISGNRGTAITIGGGTAGGEHVVQGNFIGTDVTGTVAIPNGAGLIDSTTVAVTGRDNLIGGSEPGAGNLISGNRWVGVGLAGSGHRVEGNRIGTDRSGTAPLGNGSHGVLVSGFTASNIAVGGPATGAGNRIAYNARDGVRVEGSTRVPLRGNAMGGHATGLGIRLVGANNNQAAPQLSDAGAWRGWLRVVGALHSAADTAYTLEFFASPSCHPSGFGEGQQVVGTHDVTTDAAGAVSFTATFKTPVPRGWVLTATATDPLGNTSAFSGCVAVRGVAAWLQPLALDLAPLLGRGVTPWPVPPANDTPTPKSAATRAPAETEIRVPAEADGRLGERVFPRRGVTAARTDGLPEWRGDAADIFA